MLHNLAMHDDKIINHLQDFVGKQVEIIAFDISYMGTLTQVDYDRGTLKIVEGEDFAVLEIERIESFNLIERAVLAP